MLVSKIGDIGETVIMRELHADWETNEQLQKDVLKALERYLAGDWGNLDPEDKALNDAAVAEPNSDRILARYSTCKGDIYIITEWDRSYTSLMYCSEY